MPRLDWISEALKDLQAMIDYIADRSILAADGLRTRIEDTAARLVNHPFLYRPGQVSGAQEAVVHPNYMLVHRVGFDAFEVLAVLHVQRRYP